MNLAKEKCAKIDQNTGSKKKIIARWSGKCLGRWHWWTDERFKHSYLIRRILKKMTFPITNIKTFWSLKKKVPLNWRKKAWLQPKRQCNRSTEMTHLCPGNHTPFDVFSFVMNLNPYLNGLADQLNLYVQQNRREFKTNTDE